MFLTTAYRIMVCAVVAFQNFVKNLVAVGNTECIAAIEQSDTPRHLLQFTAFSLMHAHLNRSVHAQV